MNLLATNKTQRWQLSPTMGPILVWIEMKATPMRWGLSERGMSETEESKDHAAFTRRLTSKLVQCAVTYTSGRKRKVYNRDRTRLGKEKCRHLGRKGQRNPV